MKPRTNSHIFLALALLTLGLGCSPRPPQSPVLGASISRDCAPWDGSAFTLSIPSPGAGVVQVSIWRAPDIAAPIRFAFPDPNQRDGNTSYRHSDGTDDILSGTVTFRSVQVGAPVEGQFRLASKRGAVFEGRFIAEWGTVQAYCG